MTQLTAEYVRKNLADGRRIAELMGAYNTINNRVCTVTVEQERPAGSFDIPSIIITDVASGKTSPIAIDMLESAIATKQIVKQ